MRESLSAVGKVESVSFHHWTRAHEICDGVCTVRMVRSHTISCNLVIDGFPVKVSYPGQALECDISEESGHIAKKLFLGGKCLECRLSGHLQHHCPVHLRWLQRSVDSLDPVPSCDGSGTLLGASLLGTKASPFWLMSLLLALVLPLQSRACSVFRLALLSVVLRPKFQIHLRPLLV